jgi:rhodanese-related sulfurtransferase
MALLIVSLSKGQNKWGFETMVNTLLTEKVDTISSDELSSIIQEESIILLDAREAEEFEVSHLKGAKRVGYDSPDYGVVEGVDKDAAIVVYCSVGKRSEDIGLELKSKGFTNVKNLYGGIFDWTNRGLEVIDNQNNEVKRVHPYNSVWGVWVNNYEKSYGAE